MFSSHTTRSPFRDRRDAGRQLAVALQYLKESQPVILALPRGGVPVAFEVAQALHAPLDVFLVRKLGAPYFPELGLGAVAEGAEHYCVLNEDLVERTHASDDYLEEEKQRQLDEMGRRRARYRGGRKLVDLQGRTVVIIDDGVATGGTMKVALQAVAAAHPERLLFAVPVAPKETVAALCDLADDGVCLLSPEHFRAVSQYYTDFDQTSDEEVVQLLQQAQSFAKQSQPEKENPMEQISEVMTPDVSVVSPQDSIQQAAQIMRDRNVGALPVCDGQKLIGMITDRDITIRATAGGQPPDQVRVDEVMTDDIYWCYEDQLVGEVLQQMGDSQIRRIPVVNRQKELVGMVSLGDLATRVKAHTDDTLEDISKPSEPVRQSADEVRLRRPPSDQADGRF
ncbi:MAG TPA: CBS domain-containing protein [Noviherbaspirillum sp.]|nr:CBS domain-containing protein [Noviherbaspirillum sp.]